MAGSQARLAMLIGPPVKQQHVSLWLRTRLSADYVIAVARAVDFRVTPHELRPDMYPHPEDGMRERDAVGAG